MMSVSKFLKMMEQNKLVIIGIFLVLAFVFFAPKKNLFTSPMTNDASSKVKSETDSNEWESKPRTLWSEFSPGVISQIHDGATGVSSKPPSAAEPVGMNGGPANADGIQTVTAGLPPNCNRRTVTNPSDLLPTKNNEFGSINQNGVGDLAEINLLKSGYHAGVDTIGSTLRNANLQLRSEPPNPSTKVSPWLNSTIEPDLMRVPLEIGCGPQ